MSAEARIGLFGGSFDPPHRAHLALARLALEALALTELRWVPAGQPWQKAGRQLADGRHRAAMVRLLAAGEPRFIVDERELHRQGPSYTVDSVREMQRQSAGGALFLVIGQDQYARLDTWHEWPALLERVTLAVAAREGVAPAAPPAVAAVAHRLCTLPLPAMAISSSAVRAALARGEPVHSLTGPEVARYIALHHLYPKDAAAH